MTTNVQMIEGIERTELHHARKAKALKLAQLLDAEYPIIGMQPVFDDDDVRVTGWMFDDGNDDFYETETAEVPSIADVLEAAEEYGVDLEGEEEDDEPSGTIVKEVYRIRYAEVSSTGQSNGDWLAEQLAADTMGIDGFNVDDFANILANNEVDQSGAWARLPESGQKGWVGRWRMNGRQVLEKFVALRGYYVDATGTRLEVPADFLLDLRARHAKWMGMQMKLAEEFKPE